MINVLKPSDYHTFTMSFPNIGILSKYYIKLLANSLN